VTVLGFGACAGSRSGSNPCLDKCTARAGSSLERSTCELECKQTAAAPTDGPQAQPTQPVAAPASDPGQPQPAQPTTTGPKRYAGDTGPRQAPPGAPAVRSNVPAPGSTTPAAPTGPSMAELQAQRGRCESTCDAENTSNSDRATCRLQCAQITDRPATTTIPRSTGSTTGSTTTQPAPADRGSIAACEATCNSEATPATDRATCRLNCNATGSVGPAPTTQNVLHGAPPDTSNRRAEVIRSSGGVVPQNTPGYALTPADAQKVAQCSAQAQQCSNACTVKQAPCNRGCDEGKLSATDRATCKLTCDSNVDGCRDDCRIKEGSCRGPIGKR
jgi:hypothetical protein